MSSTLTFLLSLIGCKQKSTGLSAIEPYLADDASVPMKLEPVESLDGSQQWIVTYESLGKTAKFKIELGPAELQPENEFNIRSGEGRFIPAPESDSSVLLADLEKALQAHLRHTPAAKKTTVPFTYAILGEKLSEARNGGFSVQPAGEWTAMKLFLGAGEEESELFLNVNSKRRTARFSMKDPDYGDLVLAELAKVL